MSKWRDISTVTDGDRVIVFVPSQAERPVFEAEVNRDGKYWDPVYYEWDGSGATMWQPLPEPPTT